MSFLNQEMTDHDLAAWTDDLLTRIELRVLMEHEVINHQGHDAVFQNRRPRKPNLACEHLSIKLEVRI
jgi:hypothetical protein